MSIEVSKVLTLASVCDVRIAVVAVTAVAGVASVLLPAVGIVAPADAAGYVPGARRRRRLGAG